MIEQSLLNLGFRPLLEAALDATVVVDSLGRVVALNHEVERLLGWSEQELLGQPMNRLIPQRFHGILDTLPVFNQEPQERQPKGTRRDVPWRCRSRWPTPRAKWPSLVSSN